MDGHSEKISLIEVFLTDFGCLGFGSKGGFCLHRVIAMDFMNETRHLSAYLQINSFSQTSHLFSHKENNPASRD